MQNGRDDDDVAIDLEVRLQKIIMADLIVNQEKQAKDVPEDDGNSQISDGSCVGGTGRQGMNGKIDRKHKTDDDEPDLDDPREPILDFAGENHNALETRNSKLETRPRLGEFRVSNFEFRCVSLPIYQSS
jgi:hypothetical protein